MTETERVLRAMPSLVEFTVADLVRVTGAQGATVRTVLRRHAEDLELVRVEDTGRPGGKWKRYRFSAGAAPAIAADVMGADAMRDDEDCDVPTELLAAEELLLDPESLRVAAPARASLLRRAIRFRDDASPARAGEAAATRAHRLAVNTLIGLAEGEAAGDAQALARARECVRLSRPLLSMADDDLITALERRLDSSPLPELLVSAGQSRLAGVVEAMHGYAAILTGHAVQEITLSVPTGNAIAGWARERVAARGRPSARLAREPRALELRELGVPSSLRIGGAAGFGVSNQLCIGDTGPWEHGPVDYS